MPFQYYTSIDGSKPQTVEYELAPSTTLNDGDACKFDTQGKVIKVSGQTDKPLLVAAGKYVSTATGGEVGLFLHAAPNSAVWMTSFTPTCNGATASGGSTTTATVAFQTYNYTANQLRGGTIFVKGTQIAAQPTSILNMNTGSKAIITASTDNTAPGGNSTLTVTTTMAATMNGLVIYGTPLGRGSTAVQLETTFDTISQDPAKQSSGFLRVIDVDPLRGLAYVTFLP